MGRDELKARLAQARLCVITDRKQPGGASIIRTVLHSLEGRVPMVQLRDKNLPDELLLVMALEVRKLTRESGALFIVNDRPDIAAEVGADGVHVGQGDTPVSEARRIVGPDKLIGLSVENLEQARKSKELDVDYLGVGPLYATPTKPDAAPPTGLGIFQQMKEAGVVTPAFAIGGVNLENAGEILKAGAWGLAVVSAIVSAENPEEAVRAFREILEKNPWKG